jgi:hypothetical protein
VPIISRYVFKEFITNRIVVVITLSLMVLGTQFTRACCNRSGAARNNKA